MSQSKIYYSLNLACKINKQHTGLYILNLTPQSNVDNKAIVKILVTRENTKN